MDIPWGFQKKYHELAQRAAKGCPAKLWINKVECQKNQSFLRLNSNPHFPMLAYFRLGLPNETSILENLILILEIQEFSRMIAVSGFKNIMRVFSKNPQNSR